MTGDPLFDWFDSDLPKADAIAPDYWQLWKIVDPLSIREAARLLAGLDPKPRTNRMDSDKVRAAMAEACNVALIRAVQTGRVRSASSLAWYGMNGETASCDHTSEELCDATTIYVADLVRWATDCGVPHRWPVRADEHRQSAPDISRYPPELRAAIEVFAAVRDDMKALAGRHPKQALRAWLDANKAAELSENARDRIATVANWQQVGGAPKTPGE
jgi:hypothetical protein